MTIFKEDSNRRQMERSEETVVREGTSDTRVECLEDRQGI